MMLQSGKRLVLLVLVISLMACSSTSKDKYGTAGGQPLEVPPGLSQPEQNSSMAIPSIASDRTSYSEYSQGSKPVVDTSLLPAPKGARMVREGDIRWLEIEAPTEKVWQELHGFFRSLGFEIKQEDPQLGILQTSWQENRAYASTGFWSSVFNVFKTSIKDRYRVRLERTDDPNLTRMFLMHQGVKQEVDERVSSVGGDVITMYWTNSPYDPEIEAEMMLRFLAYRGMSEEKLEEVAKVKPRDVRAELKKVEGGQVLVVNENFARTWRRTGVAIDRLGITIDDRNRSEGLYFISLGEEFLKNHQQQEGVFKKLFGGKETEGHKFILKVTDQVTESVVSLHDKEGKLSNDAGASTIMDLLYAQLR